MALAQQIEQHLSNLFYVALLGGLLFPAETAFLDNHIVLFLSAALFFIFLKIDVGAMGAYLRQPILLAYLIIVFLIVIPALVFFGIRFIDLSLAVGFLLLFGVPTAATSAVLVDLLKGNPSFGLVLQFLLYIFAPFTLPFLILILAGTTLSIDAIGLFVAMVQLLLIPLIAAQIVRRMANTRPLERYSAIVSILMLALIALGVMGKQASFVLANIGDILVVMALLYPLYALVGILSVVLVFWKSSKERRTVAVSKIFMNGSLALVLASQFFGPEVVLVVLANIIVWYTSLSVAKYLLK